MLHQNKATSLISFAPLLSYIASLGPFIRSFRSLCSLHIADLVLIRSFHSLSCWSNIRPYGPCVMLITIDRSSGLGVNATSARSARSIIKQQVVARSILSLTLFRWTCCYTSSSWSHNSSCITGPIANAASYSSCHHHALVGPHLSANETSCNGPR